MSKLETIAITNPTKNDFTHRYDGEPYTIKAGEDRVETKDVAFHLAKHLSNLILAEENPKKDPTKITEKEAAKEGVRFAQLMVYDNPKRRVALYRILNSAPHVQELIGAYHFKGFIGEMDDYKKFVIKAEGKFEERKPGEKETLESITEKMKDMQKELDEMKKQPEKVDKNKAKFLAENPKVSEK